MVLRQTDVMRFLDGAKDALGAVRRKTLPLVDRVAEGARTLEAKGGPVGKLAGSGGKVIGRIQGSGDPDVDEVPGADPLGPTEFGNTAD